MHRDIISMLHLDGSIGTFFILNNRLSTKPLHNYIICKDRHEAYGDGDKIITWVVGGQSITLDKRVKSLKDLSTKIR